MNLSLLILMLVFVAGVVLRPSLKRIWRKTVRVADTPENFAEAERKAYERGKNEALVTLVETDENAAIIEALAQQKLVPTIVGRPIDPLHLYPYRVGQAALEKWEYRDHSIIRANLKAEGKTPREAYRAYVSLKDVAAKVCEQLDEIERTKKAAAEDSHA